MKNITLAIEDEVLDKVRVVAAEKRTTVNALVREYLTELAGAMKKIAKARRELLELMETSEGRMGAGLEIRAAKTAMNGKSFRRHERFDLCGDRSRRRAGKYRRAKNIVAYGNICLSTQVIGEFCRNVQNREKMKPTVDHCRDDRNGWIVCSKFPLVVVDRSHRGKRDDGAAALSTQLLGQPDRRRSGALRRGGAV